MYIEKRVGLCVKEKVKIESKVLKSQKISFVCIAGVMATSLMNVSNPSSLENIFDRDILQKLYIMVDMVQEKYEDKRDINMLHEKLIAMNEEK